MSACLQKFPRERIAFSIDGLSSVIGSLLGSSPLTAYIDSAPGIRAGARTGIAACVVAFWFMLTMFFTPLLGEFPLLMQFTLLVLVISMQNITKPLDLCAEVNFGWLALQTAYNKIS